MLNLDTHVLIHALTGRVTARERRLLKEHSWGISAIVFWELAKLSQLKRIELDLRDLEVVRTLSSLKVWPLDLAVSLRSTQLDFNADPADELIAATSIVHNVPLLTRDTRIRDSRLVPLA